MAHPQASSVAEVAKFYQGLPVDGEEIRVLDILPGIGRAKLRGRLRVVSIALRWPGPECPYEALSYPCGASTKGRTIELSGSCSIRIYDNLYQALRHLRHRFEKRTLWVDAACINQTDDVEKGHQVARMGAIYKNATSVIIWLGEPGLVLPINISYLCRLDHPPFSRRFPGDTIPGPRWYKLTNHYKSMDKAIQNCLPRWYERAWVVQEYLLAQKVYLSYGHRRSLLDMNLLEWKFWPDSKEARRLPCFQQLVRHFAQELDPFRPGLPYGKVGLIEGGIQSVAKAAAADPRDKIYSLLAFVKENEASMIQPDYTLTPAEVFAKATFVSMKARHDLEVLRLKELYGNEQTENLPSWVVDFASVAPMLEANDILNVLRAKNRKTFSLHPGYTVDLDSSYRYLTLQGHVFDSVANIMAITPSEVFLSDMVTLGDNDLRWSADTIQQWEAFIRAAAESVEAALDDSRSTPRTDVVAPRLLPQWRSDALSEVATSGRITQRNATPIPAQQEILRAPVKADQHPLWALRDAFELWRNLAMGNVDVERRHPNTITGSYGKYAVAAAGQCSLFSTSCGLIGLAPSTVAVGNKIILAHGYGNIFLALRESDPGYEFRGSVWIYDFGSASVWDGDDFDAWNAAENLGLQKEKFVLQ